MIFLAGPIVAGESNSTLTTSSGLWQDQADQVPAVEVPIDEKALKYHAALQRRPAPGFLFDRFYNTWLDTSSIKRLEEFLVAEAEQSKATADRLLLAFFYAKQGDDVKSLEQFRVALANDPTNAETLYEKAVVEARTLDFETAIKDLKQAAETNPKSETAVKIAQLRGKLLIRNRQNDEAIKVWQQLIKDNPTDEALFEDVIELQISEGLYDEAMALSDQLIGITKDPYQQVMRTLRKGDILQRSGKRDDALKIYGGSLAKVGNGTWLEREILGQIDRLFRREDDLVGLNEYYKTLIENDGQRISIRKASSRLLVELGSYDDAVKAYEEIVKLTPGDRANRESFVALLSQAGFLDQAVKQSETLIQQFPNDTQLLVQLASLNHQASKPAAAIAAIKRFLEVSDKSEYAYLRAARLHERFKNADEALSMYRQTVTTFPESESAKESLASYLYHSYQDDKTQEAQKQEAIELWTSLAQGADRAGLVRVARIIGSHQEHQTAFDLLFSRYEEFRTDSIFLGQLITEAAQLDKFEEAIPWTLARVRFAENSGDLNSCLVQAVQLISQAKKIPEQTESLQKSKNRNVQLTCLLAELLDRSLQPMKADQLLNQELSVIKQLESTDVNKQKLLMLAQQRVRLLTTRRDFEAAIVASEELVELPGGRRSVNVKQLVDLAIRSGDYATALKWVNEWKKLSPGSLTPWFKESIAYERSGKPEDAVNVLRIASQKFPNEPELIGELGQQYEAAGQYKDAERIFWRQYEEAKELSDRLRWAESLAQLADNTGEVEDLVKKLEQRRKNNPKSIEPLLAIALTHRIAGNYEERRSALLRATQLQQDNVTLLYEIARMEQLEGEWEKAIETLQRADKIDTTDQSKQKIAQILLEYGETQRGLAMLVEISGGNTADPRDIEKIAVSITGNSDWELAREFLFPQIDAYREDYRLQFLAGVCAEEMEDYPEAISRFLPLLEPVDEVAKLPKSLTQTYSQYYIDAVEGYREIVSNETVEIFLTTYANYYAFSYREDSSGYFGYGGGYGRSKPSPIPPSADQCRTWTIAHLAGIYDLLDTDEQADFKQRLRDAGVQHVDLILNFEDFNDMSTAMEYVDENPDDRVAFELAMVASFDNDEVDDEFSRLVYEKFRESKPALALVGAIQVTHRDPEFAPQLKLAIAAAKEIKANQMVASVIARYNGGMARYYGEQEESEIPREQMDELNALLVSWYSDLRDDPNIGEWLFESVATSLLQGDRPSELVKFIDVEIEAQSKLSKSKQFGGFSSYGYFGGPRFGMYDQPLGQLPTFPPSTLIQFPEGIATFIARSEPEEYGNGMFGGMRNALMGNEADPEVSEEFTKQFAEAIKSTKHPVARILFEYRLISMSNLEMDPEDEAVFKGVKTAIEAALKTYPTDIDVMYLAACFSARQQDWHESCQRLESMRNLPMDSDTRQRIDAHLVALATQGIVTDLEKKEYEPIVSSAKAAALRMRRGNLNPEQRQMLVSVLGVLGLNTEAEKMEEQLNSAVASGGPMTFSGPSVVPVDRIRKLADEGKKDAAARLLNQQFRTLARPMFSIQQMTYNQYELRELTRQISEYGLRKTALKQLEPSENDSQNNRAIWAIANEFFGDKEVAIKTYGELVETGKRTEGYRARLVLLTMKDDPKVFGVAMDAIDSDDRESLANAVVSHFFSYDENDFEVRIAVAEKMIDWLKQQSYDPNQRNNDDHLWTLTVLNSVGNEMSVNSFRSMNSLYSVKEPTTKDKDEEQAEKKLSDRAKRRIAKDKELNATHRRVHDALATEMLRFPATASSGFSALVAAEEAAGGRGLGEETLKTAIETVKRFANAKSSNNAASVQMSYQSFHQSTPKNYDNNGALITLVPMRSPSEFITRSLAFGYGAERSVNAEQLDENRKTLASILAELPEVKNQNLKNMMQGEFELYAAPDKEFTNQSIARYEKAMEGLRRTQKRAVSEHFLNRIVQIWKERDINDESLTEFVVEKFTDDDGWVNGYELPSYVQTYYGELGKRDVVQLRKFFRICRDRILGDQEEQQQMRELIFAEDKTVERSKYGKRMTKFNYLLYYAIQNSSAMIPALEEAAYWRRNDAISNGEWEVRALFEQQVMASPEKFGDLLKGSTLIGSIDEFEPLCFSDPELRSLWGETLVYIVNDSSPRNREKAVEFLKDQSERTFGEEVLFQMMTADDPTEFSYLFNILGDHLDEFAQLPDYRKRDLGAFYSASSRVNTDKLTEAGAKAQAAINEVVEWTSSSSLESLLEARRVSAFAPDEYEFVQRVGSLIVSIKPYDKDQVAQAFKKAVVLAKRNPTVMGYLDYGTPEEDILSYAMNSMDDVSQLTLVYDLTIDPENQNMMLNAQAIETMREILQSDSADELKRLTDEEASSPKLKRTLGMIRTFEKVAKAIGNRDGRLFAVPVSMMLRNSSEFDRDRLAKWIQMEKTGDFDQLILGWELGLQIHDERIARREQAKQRKQKLKEKGIVGPAASIPIRLDTPSDYQQSIIAIVNNESLPRNWRSMISVQLLQVDSQLPLESLADIAEQLLIDIDAKRSVPSDTASFLLDSASVFTVEQHRELMEKIGAFWRKTYLTRQTNYFSGSSESLMQAIDLFATIDQREVVNQIVSRFRDELANSKAIVALVSNEFYQPARLICSEMWRRPEDFSEFGEDRYMIGYFSKSLEAKIDPFVETFPREDERYLARVFLSSLPDAEDEKQKPSTSRDNRLLALAETFQEMDFKSKSGGQLALLLLAESEKTSDLLAEPLARAALSVKSVDIWSQGSASSAHLARIVGKYFGAEAEDGKVDAIMQLVDKLYADENTDTSSWEFRNLMTTICAPVTKKIRAKLETGTQEELEEFLPLLKKLGAPQVSGYNSFIDMNIMVHLICDRADELIEVYEEIRDGISEPGYYYGEMSLKQMNEVMYKRLTANDKKPTDEQRIKMAQQLWKLSSFAGISFSGSSHFDRGVQDDCPSCRKNKYGLDMIVKTKMLTSEEVAKYGAELAEIESVNGEIWRQVALAQKTAKDLEGSVASYQQAIKAAQPEMYQAVQNRSVEMAEILIELKKTDEAKQAIKDVEAKTMIGDNMERLKTVKTKLGIE
ncbi:MAG: tetratricopeptide repeat protein [Planctomycetota bacterium]